MCVKGFLCLLFVGFHSCIENGLEAGSCGCGRSLGHGEETIEDSEGSIDPPIGEGGNVLQMCSAPQIVPLTLSFGVPTALDSH